MEKKNFKLTEHRGIDTDRVISKQTSSYEEVICLICLKILYNPMACSQCESHFCLTCIQTWQKKKNQCPFNCNLKISKASKIINSILSKLKIKCLYHVNGCLKIDLYETILKHEKMCGFKLYKCTGCYKEVESKEQHISECFKNAPFRVPKEEKIQSSKLNKNICEFKIVNISERNFNVNFCENFIQPINNEVYDLSLLRCQGSNEFNINSIPSVNFEQITPNRNFNDWIKASGGYIGNVDICIENGARSVLLAREAVKQGEELIIIPEELLIKVSDINTDNEVELISNLNFNKELLYLTKFLISEKEKNESSNYFPILEIAASNYVSYGIRFEHGDITWLKGSSLFEKIRFQKEEMRKTYDYLSKDEGVDYEIFCWAYSLANSSTFQIPGQVSPFLNPLIDITTLETQQKALSYFTYDVSKKALILKASKDIEKDSTITLYPGHKSNHTLLLYQGIILEDNPNDDVEINLFFNNYDNLIDKKIKLFDDMLDPYIFKLRADVNHPIFQEFLAFMRIIEIDNVKELQRDFGYYMKSAVSVSNELKVIKKLGMILNSRLKNYDTSDDQDSKLVKSDFLTENQKKCVKIRICEKKILKELLEFVNYATTVLENKKVVKVENKYGKYLQSLNELL
jgi:histone-lysine N-methyltransferase SETD3